MSYPVRTCSWAYLKSIAVTVLVSLTNVRYILRTPNYTGQCHSCVPCGAAWQCLHPNSGI